jgi:pimeloyl-ACP methyl ester carboxylesterase
MNQQAKHLSDHHHVLCPDLIGRGASAWMANESLYNHQQYIADLTNLIARSGAEKIHWIGTSMGGMLGMFLAIQPNSPIKSLVINDVGAFISGPSLLRIAKYVKAPPQFDSLQKAEKYVRQILAPFGPLSPEDWEHLVFHSLKDLGQGIFALNYDPKIAHQVDEEDVNLWGIWSMIQCPTLILRGENSDILSREVAAEMVHTNPHARLVEIAETGHAPALMNLHQKRLIKDWIESVNNNGFSHTLKHQSVY